MKKFLLSVAVMMAAATGLQAADFVVDGISYNVLSSGTDVEVTELVDNPLLGTTDYPANVVIPATVTYKDVTYNVVAIGTKAFYFSNTVETIQLPETIKSIGEDAFSNSNMLTTVNIPSGVTFIGERAFSTCPKIRSLVVPEGITSLSDYVFYSCRGLRQLTLPASLESIGYASLRYCRALVNITIPSGVKKIDDYGFAQCSALESVSLPDGLEYIGESAFSGCEALESIEFPASVDFYGNNICYGCAHLETAVVPEGVTAIPNYMFYQCSALETFEIPSTVTLIGKYAFEYAGLKSLTVPASVDEIGIQAFDGLTGLKTLVFEEGDKPLTIGKGYLGKSMFSDSSDITTLGYGRNFIYEVTPLTTLTKLKKLEIGANVTDINCITPLNNINLNSITSYAAVPPETKAFDSETYEFAELTVPYGCKEAYATADVWKNFKNVKEMSENTGILNPEITGEEPTVWFDLNGNRVINPSSGIFIRLSGKQSTKVIVK